MEDWGGHRPIFCPPRLLPDGGRTDGQAGISGSPEGAHEDEEKLLDWGHPILVRSAPAERDLSVKLLKYFGSQSKSGGGECDVIKVDGQTYCAIFNNEDDQRRVLSRQNHVIEFTVSVKVHNIRREDLSRIRQLSDDGERLKMLQQLAVSAQISESFSFNITQEEEEDNIIHGPRDKLSQTMKALEKGDHKPARPRRVVTISREMSTEIPVDVRHMDILRKLKNKEISDIEQKYNVKMEECRKNSSVLITFKAVNAPLDLSRHASHSFITLLQNTFYNLEKKVISVMPDIQEERVRIVQEQLLMGGIDIVMEYSNGCVLLIGHPVHVAFAEEELNGSQD